jgi:branched-chain amino acid transport system substrate-binding protein
VVGSILDLTGLASVVGQADYNVQKLAIKQWNAHGGLLGKKVALKFYDSGQDQAKYVQFATELATRDHPDVAMGGIGSAAREAIRPVFDKNNILYFYNELYEGGVCDKDLFATGTVPSQNLAPLVPWLIKKYGPKVYIVAADYNYGQIASAWAKRYIDTAGGKLLGEEFVPLQSSDFGSIIDKIQREKPNVVLSFLVGNNHVAFYRAYAAAGLNNSIPIGSTAFGLSGEQQILTAEESKNVFVSYGYFPQIQSPANRSFLHLYENAYGAKATSTISDSSVAMWNGMQLWAKAVEKAGTTDRAAVTKVLEAGGVSFDGPGGSVTIDPGSHHAVQSVSIAQTDGKSGFKVIETTPAVKPAFEMEKCNLLKNPTTNEQFTP